MFGFEYRLILSMFGYCVKVSFDTGYVLCNVLRLPFGESLWLLFTRLRLA